MTSPRERALERIVRRLLTHHAIQKRCAQCICPEVGACHRHEREVRAIERDAQKALAAPERPN